MSESVCALRGMKARRRSFWFVWSEEKTDTERSEDDEKKFKNRRF